MASREKKAPHFIGIGAQRSGSTWLYRNLKKHPDIWVPPKKELHYFDRSLDYPTEAQLSAVNLWERLFSRAKPGRQWRSLLGLHLRSALKKRKGISRLKHLAWFRNYMLGKYDDEWYLNLFPNDEGKLAGEVTPSYSILKQEDVKKIRNLLPDLKIIFVMRNPLERAWSHTQFFVQGKEYSVKEAFFAKHLEREGVFLRGQYVRTLKNWRAHFPEEQIFIGFYEEIENDSKKFFDRVCRFLGVSEMSHESLLRAKVNPTKPMVMPEAIQRQLAKQYLPVLKELSGEFEGFPANWLQQAEEILGLKEKQTQA